MGFGEAFSLGERADKGQRQRKTPPEKPGPGVEVSYSGLVTAKQGPGAAGLVNPALSVTCIPGLDNETGGSGGVFKTKSFF